MLVNLLLFTFTSKGVCTTRARSARSEREVPAARSH